MPGAGLPSKVIIAGKAYVVAGLREAQPIYETFPVQTEIGDFQSLRPVELGNPVVGLIGSRRHGGSPSPDGIAESLNADTSVEDRAGAGPGIRVITLTTEGVFEDEGEAGTVANDDAFGTNAWTVGIAAPPSLLNEREGIVLASNVTGGDGQTPAVVTNNNDSGAGSLRAAAESGSAYITFDNDYTITLTSGSIDVGDDVTIDGQGFTIVVTTDGSFNAPTFNVQGAVNVIITDIAVANVGSGGAKDCIAVLGDSDLVWIHHCVFTDYGDEAVDISAKGTGLANMDVGVTWCKFTGAIGSGFLGIGHTVSGYATNPDIRVTVAHNWFDGANSTGSQPQRMPFVTDGVRVDCYNNVKTYDNGGLHLFEFRDEGTTPTEGECTDCYFDVEASTPNFDDWVFLFTCDGTQRLSVTNAFLTSSATTPACGSLTVDLTGKGSAATASATMNPGSITSLTTISGYVRNKVTMTTAVRDAVFAGTGPRTS